MTEELPLGRGRGSGEKLAWLANFIIVIYNQEKNVRD